MPVRSLTSSVLRWPATADVLGAARLWADTALDRDTHVVRVGLFGSYARDEAAVGSDLDLIVVLDETSVPFTQRAAGWDTTGLPVPTDLLVYTEAEWAAMVARQARVSHDVRWLADRARS